LHTFYRAAYHRAFGQNPVQPGGNIGKITRARIAEDFHGDYVRLRGHTDRSHRTFRSDDSGYAGPMPIVIFRTRTLAGSARAAPAQKGGRMRVAKTVLGNQIVGQIRMIRIDSRVENRHFHAGSRVSKTVRIIPPNETHTLCEYRMYFCVQIQELHLSVQRQTINRRPLHPESNPAEGAVSALHLKAPMGEGVQNTLLTRLDCNPSRPPDRRQIVLAQRNTDRDPLRLQIRLEQATEMSAKAGRSADRALRLHGQRVLARSGGNVHAA